MIVAALVLTLTTAAPATVPASERRAILAAISGSAFRHPRRHSLVPTTLNADGRFAFVALHRKDGSRIDGDGEFLRFFDSNSGEGAETEFFLRKAAGKWRIMYWMPVISEGAPDGEGFVFDYRPLMATGFPARLSPANLRRTWATKWIYGKEGVVETVVTDVATLDRHRDSSDAFMLDGHTVYRHGLDRP